MVDLIPRPDASCDAAVATRCCVLVLNSGSSSVKFALFSADQRPMRHLVGAVDGIGRDHGRFHAKDETGIIWMDDKRHVSNQEEAIELILSAMERRGAGLRIVAAGHRIVHGGPDCDCPKLVTAELENQLEKEPDDRIYHRSPVSIRRFTKRFRGSRE